MLFRSGETLAELRSRTRKIKKRLAAIGCEVNESKSEYEKTSLLFLGMWVFATGIGPNVQKVRDLTLIPAPTTKADMQSALGLVSYLRDFSPLVSHFTASLYPKGGDVLLDAKSVHEEWTKLQKHLASAITTLRHWREDLDADLYADASGHGIGLILIQDRKVVALASRKLSPAESRYSATDREHLALVYAAKKFKVFLHRSQAETRVWSDHAALLSRKSNELTPRQARWQSITQCWMPLVKHVAGKRNPADYISRWGLEIFGGAVKL